MLAWLSLWCRALHILLSRISFFRRSLSFLLSWCSWRCPLLIALFHYGITRLVTVILLVQILLPFHLLGISIS